VTLAVYDARGRRVVNLIDRMQTAGQYEVLWYGRDARRTSVASGVYSLRPESAGVERAEKVVVIR
jgi:hypothetical protein